MNNTFNENISEHSLQVAMFTHCLILMHNDKFGENLNADRGAVLGMYHDSSEIITGDLPTPIKYFNPEICDAYKKVENLAEEKLLSLLPQSLRHYYDDILHYNEKDEILWKYVKAGDKISALTKCMEEIKVGNREFTDAFETTKKSLENMNMPVVDEFIKEFIPSFQLTLDKLE